MDGIVLWIVLAVVVGLIDLWTILRKGVAGIPLALGVTFLYVTGVAAAFWFPPSIGKLILLMFMAGFSLALIVWGIVNIIVNRLISRPLYIEQPLGNVGEMTFKVTAVKESKSPYGVLYGYLPWNEEGAGWFARFLNENVWGIGYKVEQLNVECVKYAGQYIAFIWGIIRPKTIIDRILY